MAARRMASCCVRPRGLLWVPCAFCSHDICSSECGPGVGAQVKPGIVSAATLPRTARTSQDEPGEDELGTAAASLGWSGGGGFDEA